MQTNVAAVAERTLAREHVWWKWVVLAVQLAIYPFCFLLRLAVVRGDLRRVEANVTGSGRYVVFANHQSKLDPFVICTTLRFRDFRRMLPIRGFVENEYLRKPVPRACLTLIGGFPAHFDPHKSYGVKRALSLLEQNHCVLVFPQGKRTREKIAKPGIAALASDSQVTIVPVHIDWKSRLRCSVRVGKSFNPGMSHDADTLMKCVYELAGD